MGQTILITYAVVNYALESFGQRVAIINVQHKSAKVFLTGYGVAMVTYCVNEKVHNLKCLPVIGHFFALQR